MVIKGLQWPLPLQCPRERGKTHSFVVVNDCWACCGVAIFSLLLQRWDRGRRWLTWVGEMVAVQGEGGCTHRLGGVQYRLLQWVREGFAVLLIRSRVVTIFFPVGAKSKNVWSVMLTLTLIHKWPLSCMLWTLPAPTHLTEAWWGGTQVCLSRKHLRQRYLRSRMCFWCLSKSYLLLKPALDFLDPHFCMILSLSNTQMQSWTFV